MWNALAGPLGPLSVGSGRALRFRSDVNVLAAAADNSAAAAAALAALASPDDPLGTVVAEAMTPPPA